MRFCLKPPFIQAIWTFNCMRLNIFSAKYQTGTRYLTSFVLTVVLLGATNVFADSEGYFCSGDGYLVFDRFGDNTRDFHFVFFSDEGISEPKTINIPYFQPHGMKCFENYVLVKGWETYYRLDFSDRNAIQWEMFEGELPDNLEMTNADRGNLIRYVDTYEYPLTCSACERTYKLVITEEHTTKSYENAGERTTHVRSELLAFNADNESIESLELTNEVYSIIYH